MDHNVVAPRVPTLTVIHCQHCARDHERLPLERSTHTLFSPVLGRDLTFSHVTRCPNTRQLIYAYELDAAGV